MTIPLLVTIAAAWILAVGAVRFVVVPWLAAAPAGDAVVGLVWRLDQVYCRVWHRVRFSGKHLVPATHENARGLIVVSNHTGALDPLLIQAGCRFLVRWMMAADMMSPNLEWLWSRIGIIPVARDGTDSGPLREAIRHLHAGGTIGVFPEGRITTPPGEIRPFMPGVGLMIARTHAPVLLVWVSGTPDTNKMGEALRTPSAAHVTFIDRIQFDEGTEPAVIVATLRERIAAASGWPLNDEVLPAGGSPGPAAPASVRG